MEYITFTQLRTNTNNLAKALKKGDEVKLIRRSAVVGSIVSNKGTKIKTINANKLQTS